LVKAHAEDINLDVIADIESGHEPLAYNKESGAVGEYQITQGVISTYNFEFPDGKCNLEEMYIPYEDHAVANWFINQRIPYWLNDYNRYDT
jgi:hypothetical protein